MAKLGNTIVLVKAWYNLKGYDVGLFFTDVRQARKYIEMYEQDLKMLEKGKISMDMLGMRGQDKMVSCDYDNSYSKVEEGDEVVFPVNNNWAWSHYTAKVREILKFRLGY